MPLPVLLSEILDGAEFGESATNEEYNENAINPAQELELTVCDRLIIGLLLKH